MRPKPSREQLPLELRSNPLLFHLLNQRGAVEMQELRSHGGAPHQHGWDVADDPAA